MLAVGYYEPIALYTIYACQRPLVHQLGLLYRPINVQQFKHILIVRRPIYTIYSSVAIVDEKPAAACI